MTAVAYDYVHMGPRWAPLAPCGAPLAGHAARCPLCPPPAPPRPAPGRTSLAWLYHQQGAHTRLGAPTAQAAAVASQRGLEALAAAQRAARRRALR